MLYMKAGCLSRRTFEKEGLDPQGVLYEEKSVGNGVYGGFRGGGSDNGLLKEEC